MSTVTEELSKPTQVQSKSALWILIWTFVAAVVSLAIPLVSVGTIALGIVAAILIRKAKHGPARGFLIAALIIAIISLCLLVGVTASWYWTTA